MADLEKTQGELKKWQERAQRLAASNERLRAGVMRIQDRARDLPHVVLQGDQGLHDYCRSLLKDS